MGEKFHLDKNGDPKPCSATVRNCPIGGEHYDTIDAARTAYEQSMTGHNTISGKRKENAQITFITSLNKDVNFKKNITNMKDNTSKSMKPESKPMSAKEYAVFEQHIANLFTEGSTIEYEGETYMVKDSGKPMVSKGGGEAKTDVYISLLDKEGKLVEYKLSLKKDNAEFIENKLSKERLIGIFGENYAERLRKPLQKLAELVEKKATFYNESKKRNERGVLVGLRMDFTNKERGMSVVAELTDDETVELYSGANLPDLKKHSLVNGRMIRNSGVAEYMLLGNLDDYKTPQDVMSKAIPISEYVKDENTPKIHMVLGGVNLREKTHEDGNKEYKIEGGRTLLVLVSHQSDGSFNIEPDPTCSMKSTDVKRKYEGQGFLNSKFFDAVGEYNNRNET